MKRFYLSILLISSILLSFSGCNGSIPTPVGQNYKVDEKLPVVVLTKNGIIVDMTEIAFEWKPITDLNVEGIKIYRSKGDSNATYLIATLSNRYATHFVDLDVQPDTKYTYVLRTYRDDVVSAKSKKIVVYSKPPLPSVSWIYARNGLPRMAKLLWRPHSDKSVKSYIIERKSIEEKEWQEIGKRRGRLQAEYIDEGLKDKHTYKYRVRVKTFEGILSTPSEIVTVVTKPLPPEITGLHATTNLPKKIYITWNKSNYKDFERYYLYRSKRKEGDYELIAKLYNNRFTDNVGKDGATYFYKVSQKDIDGLESKKDRYVAMGMTLPKPDAPTLSEAKFDGRAIHLQWFKVDPRSVSYIVERHAKTGWFDVKKEKFTTKKREFTDTNITPNTRYSYRVYAVDKFGIISEPSKEVSIEVKELRGMALPKTNTTAKEIKTTKKSLQTPKTEVAPVDDLNVESE